MIIYYYYDVFIVGTEMASARAKDIILYFVCRYRRLHVKHYNNIYRGARGILYRSKNRDKPHCTEVRSKRIDTYIMYIYTAHTQYYTYAHCIGA